MQVTELAHAKKPAVTYELSLLTAVNAMTGNHRPSSAHSYVLDGIWSNQQTQVIFLKSFFLSAILMIDLFTLLDWSSNNQWNSGRASQLALKA